MRGHDRVAVVHAGKRHRIVLAEGDAADEALGFGGVPARGCSGEQALGAGGLHGGAAVGAAQAVAIAVVPNRRIDDLLPAAQEFGLLCLEGQAFGRVGPARFPPGEPGSAKGVHKEVE